MWCEYKNVHTRKCVGALQVYVHSMYVCMWRPEVDTSSSMALHLLEHGRVSYLDPEPANLARLVVKLAPGVPSLPLLVHWD